MVAVWAGAALIMSAVLIVVAIGRSAYREDGRVRRAVDAALTGTSGPRSSSPRMRHRPAAVVLDAFAAMLQRFLKPNWVRDTEDRLENAGPSSWLTARRYLALRGLMAPLGVGLGLLATRGQSPDLRLLLTAFFAAVLFALPPLWLRRKIDARVRHITRDLPDVLDQITISVGAGLGIDAAMSRVSRRTKGPLASELGRTMQDIRIGIDRVTAMKSLSRRTANEDVDQVVTALVQGIEMGMPLAPVLAARATELRRKRRAAAEEKAHKLSVKLTFPTAVCILPALLLVVIGPAILTVMQNGLGA